MPELRTASHGLAIADLTHDAAQGLAEAIDAEFLLDPLAVIINELDEALSLWEVVAHFGSRAEALAARDALQLPDARVTELADRDWVRQSLEGLGPVASGRFFLHGSHDRERRRGGGINIEIDAGTAFGTGHHGTTEGCLAALDGILKQRRPSRALDLGCGTGILAIATALATRRPVLASDIDPEAVRVCLANATRNTCRPEVKCLAAPGLKHRHFAGKAPFDLIFANILARPLAGLAQGLAGMLSPGGSLILSGLTLDQTRWILAVYRNRGLVARRRICRGNWATLVLQLPKRKKRPLGRTNGRFVAGTHGAGGERAC